MPPESQTPRVTAGLTWQPEIGPMADARASSTSPKASATPTTPDRSPPPLSPATAAPTARNTSNSVPTNSAISERTSVGDTADLRGAAAAPPGRPSAATVRVGTQVGPLRRDTPEAAVPGCSAIRRAGGGHGRRDVGAAVGGQPGDDAVDVGAGAVLGELPLRLDATNADLDAHDRP